MTIARFPDEAVPRGGRADTLKLLGRVDEALEEYEAAISKFPYDAPLLCGKADVLRTMGQYEEAAATVPFSKNKVSLTSRLHTVVTPTLNGTLVNR